MHQILTDLGFKKKKFKKYYSILTIIKKLFNGKFQTYELVEDDSVYEMNNIVVFHYLSLFSIDIQVFVDNKKVFCYSSMVDFKDFFKTDIKPHLREGKIDKIVNNKND